MIRKIFGFFRRIFLLAPWTIAIAIVSISAHVVGIIYVNPVLEFVSLFTTLITITLCFILSLSYDKSKPIRYFVKAGSVVVGMLIFTAVLIPLFGKTAYRSNTAMQISKLKQVFAMYSIYESETGHPPKKILDLLYFQKTNAGSNLDHILDLLYFNDSGGNKSEWILNPKGLDESVIICSPVFNSGSRLVRIECSKFGSVSLMLVDIPLLPSDTPRI